MCVLIYGTLIVWVQNSFQYCPNLRSRTPGTDRCLHPYRSQCLFSHNGMRELAVVRLLRQGRKQVEVKVERVPATVQ